MIPDFPTVGNEDTIGKALSKMRQSGFQEIPIVENGNYAGMVSYGSVLRKGSTAPDTKVKNLVRNLPTLTMDTDITKIAELIIENNCRQLAVLNGKKIIGVVSRSSLTKIAAKMKILRDIKVWEIMTSPVESVKEGGMLDDAGDHEETGYNDGPRGKFQQHSSGNSGNERDHRQSLEIRN